MDYRFKDESFLNAQKQILENSLKNNKLPDIKDDPLFKKYARKSVKKAKVKAENKLMASLNPYTGAWTAWEVSYLLKKLHFGAKKLDIDLLLTMNSNDAVDFLFNFTATPSLPSAKPLNYYQATVADTQNIPLGGDWTTKPLNFALEIDGAIDYYRELSLFWWSYGIMLDEPMNAREKMTLFWYHFIPVNVEEVRNVIVNGGIVGYDYFTILRTYAKGNVKNLIKIISKSPAMVAYLGGQLSTAIEPNENFARELLELFTLGKEPIQNYTEDDIKAAAKVFSGWQVPWVNNITHPITSVFVPSAHNQSNKFFSSFFGRNSIPNFTGLNGAVEFDIFFDILFSSQALNVAKYIVRRLYRYYVYFLIDEDIETNIITPLATLLKNNNWNIEIAVKTLLKSEHFFESRFRGAMIKSPIDMMIGTLRTFNVNTTAPNDANNTINQYTIWSYFDSFSKYNLEQAYGLIPNVAGWKAFYQRPTYYQNWISSFTVQHRALFLSYLVSGIALGGIVIKIDFVAFVKQFPNEIIQDPDLLIEAIMPLLFSVDFPAEFKSDTKLQTLLSGQIFNSYWTTAWNRHIQFPNDMAYLNVVEIRLESLFTTLLQLAEYQLM